MGKQPFENEEREDRILHLDATAADRELVVLVASRLMAARIMSPTVLLDQKQNLSQWAVRCARELIAEVDNGSR